MIKLERFELSTFFAQQSSAILLGVLAYPGVRGRGTAEHTRVSYMGQSPTEVMRIFGKVLYVAKDSPRL